MWSWKKLKFRVSWSVFYAFFKVLSSPSYSRLMFDLSFVSYILNLSLSGFGVNVSSILGSCLLIISFTCVHSFFILHDLEITCLNYSYEAWLLYMLSNFSLNYFFVLQTLQACCSVCGSVFDEWQHKPKILSCGHTFCYNCLICVAQDVEVKCPSGCPYTTALTEAGISGESFRIIV